MSRVDALVVGAGVAGASAALGLARAGAGVMLIDRAALPRHKVCGCCLNRESVGMLGEMGLSEALARGGAVPLKRVLLCSGGVCASLPSRGGLAISRHALDAMLAGAAERAGAQVAGATTARVVRLPAERGEPVRVNCSGAGVDGVCEVEAGVVLVADGLAGTCLKAVERHGRRVKRGSLRGYGARLSAADHAMQRGEVVMRCGAAGYVGTVVLEDGSLDIAAALAPAWVKKCGGPAQAVTTLAEASGQAIRGLDSLSWRATPPLTGRRERLSLPGVMVLGDAAGYVEPFTGEGMGWALRSAIAAVPIAMRGMAEGWGPEVAQQWAQAYRASVRRRQWRCRAFSTLLRHPALSTLAVSAAGRAPAGATKRIARLALPPMFPPNPAGPMEQPSCL